MTLVEIAVIILIILDLCIFRRLEIHEEAIAELLRLHPELLAEGDEDGN